MVSMKKKIKINKRIPTRTLAAGLSIWRDFKMVAPSLVTVTCRPLPVDWRILSWKVYAQ